MQYRICALLVVGVVFVQACGDDTSSSGQGDASEAPRPFEPPPPPMEFGACPAAFEMTTDAQCGTVEVPLDWDAPEVGSIALGVFKLPASGESRGDLWLLDGGPGGSGRNLTEGWALEFDEYDVYIPQHRGTGRSSGLSCGTPDAMERCIAELDAQMGDALGHFTSWAAGRDLAYLIASVSQYDERETFVWGGSYGTTWAIHFLHHDPNGAAGVILDSPAGVTSDFTLGQVIAAEVPEYVLASCEAMPSCRARFEASVSESLDQALAQWDSPACDTDDTPQEMARFVLGSILASSPALGLALVARLARCDEAALTFLDENFPDTLSDMELFTEPDSEDEYFNSLLAYNVIRHSFLGSLDGYPEEEVRARRMESRLLVNYTPFLLMRSIIEQWPRYETAVRLDANPESDVPMLILASQMDVQTPYTWGVELAAHFNGPNQHLIPFGFAGHTVVNSSLLSDGTHCGAQVIRDFMTNPKTQPDASCVDSIIPPDFTGESYSQDEVEAIFGEGETLFGD